ncbi:variable surface protein [Plasmodium gonderi]|uniref:Variable surface protein n=1 Tax=Plasmodium gonderi TaxID=77519 RepID=A0A1Y1JS59_PLAGO|nr:variable surface protein [Plasmodium gonderi]GAW84027.1 variable surface protein [Plasmodium gonderi]
MWSNIYEYISYFPGCQKELEDQKRIMSTSYEGECKPIMGKYLSSINSDDINICTTAMSYIYNFSRTHGDISEHIHCLYLYYWIYHEFKKKGKSSDTKNLYEEFLNHLKIKGVNNICKSYVGSTTSYDHFEKVKYLYETSLCLKTIKQDGEVIEDMDFCNKLKNIIKKYNDKNISELCKSDKQEISFSRQTNTKNIIIISILITLIVLLLLFIFLKYTSFLTCLLYKLKRKISEFKNKDEELYVLDQYEDINSISMNNGYNIVYSSD